VKTDPKTVDPYPPHYTTIDVEKNTLMETFEGTVEMPLGIAYYYSKAIRRWGGITASLRARRGEKDSSSGVAKIRGWKTLNRGTTTRMTLSKKKKARNSDLYI